MGPYNLVWKNSNGFIICSDRSHIRTQLFALSCPDLAQLSASGVLLQPLAQVVFDLNAHISRLTCSECANELLYLYMLMFSMQYLAY